MAREVDPVVVFELRKFAHDNLKLPGAAPTLEDAPAEDEELRSLLIFAGNMAQGNPTLPRTLEAHRVVWLMPVEIGEELFA